jgi:hypothetical protein
MRIVALLVLALAGCGKANVAAPDASDGPRGEAGADTSGVGGPCCGSCCVDDQWTPSSCADGGTTQDHF